MRVVANLSLIALGAALLAGCLGGGDGGHGDRGLVAQSLGTFSDTLVGTGGDTESSSAVSPDGQTILACSHGGFKQASPWWVSQDGGATFRQLMPSPAPPVGGDCDVAIGPDGSWYEVFDSLLSVSIVSTSDQGATWHWSYVEDPLVGNVDRPWIQVVGSDLLVTYADLMSDQPYLVFAIRSSDGGATWSPPAIVANIHDSDATNCWVGHPATLGFQLVLVPLGCWVGGSQLFANPPLSIRFARSETGGADWMLEAPLAIAGATGVPTASFTATGTLWLAYVAGDAGSRDVMVARSLDDGRSFSDPVVVAPVDGETDWPWVDGRPDGSADVTWMSHVAPAGGGAAVWQPRIARLSAAGQVGDARAVGPTWDGDMSYEFFMVRHDGAGHAFLVHPMGGADCPGFPLAGGPANTRNKECVHLVREPAA